MFDDQIVQNDGRTYAALSNLHSVYSAENMTSSPYQYSESESSSRSARRFRSLSFTLPSLRTNTGSFPTWKAKLGSIFSRSWVTQYSRLETNYTQELSVELSDPCNAPSITELSSFRTTQPDTFGELLINNQPLNEGRRNMFQLSSDPNSFAPDEVIPDTKDTLQLGVHIRALPLPPSPPSTPASTVDTHATSLESHVFPVEHHAPIIKDFGYPKSIYGPHTPPDSVYRHVDSSETFEEPPKDKKLQASLSVAIGVLLLSTVIASVCTELAVDAIPSMVESWRISHVFLGFIVLPFVGNAAEHVTAAKMALRNRMVLAKSVAVESATQIVLFIMPAIVLLGWLRGRRMSLHFDLYEIACVVVTGIMVSTVICYGRSGYKQGICLHSIYLMFALGAIFYRGDASDGQ